LHAGEDGVNLYAVAVGSDAPVLELENGWRYLRYASELWGLVDERRSRQLVAILERIAELEEVRLHRVDIDAIVEALDGLEAALVGAVLDVEWNVPEDRIDEIMRRAPSLAFRSRPSLVERRAAAAEALHLALNARRFFEKALAHDLEVIAG
jgi:hypothetical protein